MKTTKARYQMVEKWNHRCGIGTKVRFRRDDGTILETKTRSRAEMLGGHTPVIWLDDVSGCVLLERIANT